MTSVGSSGGAAGALGRSAPRWTTRVWRAPRSRHRRAVPALLASTRRAWRERAAHGGRAGMAADGRRPREPRRAAGSAARRGGPRRRRGRHSGRGRGRRRTRRAGGAAHAGAPVPPRLPTRHSSTAGAVRRSAGSPPGSRRADRGAGCRHRLGAARHPQPAHVGERRQRPVQHEHPHVGPGIARGHRLAVGPHAQGWVRGPRVVLGDDQGPHRQRRCVAIVR